MNSETALELCKGLVTSITSEILDFKKGAVSEIRGHSHEIKVFETKAEKVGLDYLVSESRELGWTVALGYELKNRWFLINDGRSEEMKVEDIVGAKPDAMILSDPVDGSKADVRSLSTQDGCSYNIGDTDNVYSTAIAFKPGQNGVNNALACAMRNWESSMYCASDREAYLLKEGSGRLKVPIMEMNNVNKELKTYFADHYWHMSGLGHLIRKSLIDYLDVEEEQSPGVRVTGSTTADIINIVKTNAIAIDLRNSYRKVLEKNHGRTMHRGCYTHDLAPAAHFARNTGGLYVLNPETGKALDIDPLNYERSSYFIAPDVFTSLRILKIVRDEVLPGLEDLAEEEYTIFPRKG